MCFAHDATVRRLQIKLGFVTNLAANGGRPGLCLPVSIQLLQIGASSSVHRTTVITVRPLLMHGCLASCHAFSRGSMHMPACLPCVWMQVGQCRCTWQV